MKQLTMYFLVLENAAKSIKIEARSSKELVYVATDGVRIYENAVEGASSRGMHIVVLNQQTGEVMSTRIFDTYAEMLDGEMLLFLKMLQEGRIVIFLVKVSFCHLIQNLTQVVNCRCLLPHLHGFPVMECLRILRNTSG